MIYRSDLPRSCCRVHRDDPPLLLPLLLLTHSPLPLTRQALVRLATVVPLPTDAQLAEAGFAHAEPFMAALESGDDSHFQAFAHEQSCEWGDTPDAATCGEMPRRVEKLADIILRRIKQPAEPDEPIGGLTRKEFRKWAFERMGAKESDLPEAWAKEKQKGEHE